MNICSYKILRRSRKAAVFRLFNTTRDNKSGIHNLSDMFLPIDNTINTPAHITTGAKSSGNKFIMFLNLLFFYDPNGMQRAAINSLRPKQSKSLCFCSQYPEGELHIKLLFTAPNADFCHPACKAIYSKSSQTFPQLSTVFPTLSVFFYVRYLCFSLLYSWVCPPALPASCPEESSSSLVF